VTLSSSLAMGTQFTAQVFYHGTPVSGTTFSALGINSVNSPSWGTRVTFTLSESYKAKDWWPTKQSLKDKIDSADIWITVPDSLKAGSNGLLAAVTPIDATHNRYEWKERYPIDYYLISAAVAPYVDYSFYMHFTGSTDSMLVQNYVYNNPGTLPAFHSVIDSTSLMVDYLSTLYGRYPFWQEKYGHCMAPLSGGMEHETMTTLGFFEGTLVAHELGHQWFGDNATCATWADIFMNEGFAAYTENLFIDHFRSHTQAVQDMRDRQTNVKSMPGGTVYVDDTTNENRIFDSRLSYDKGACLLHMLRTIINNDSTYFQVYKTYQQNNHGSTGTDADFAETAKTVAGSNVNGIALDTFFTQWIYKEGYPNYTLNWNQGGSDVYVRIDQTTSVPASVAYFTLPVDIKLHSATGDTVVRVVNNQMSQLYHFTWSKPILSIAVDPSYWLVYHLVSINHDVTLNTGIYSNSAIVVYPNPATTGWTAAHLAANSRLSLTDVSGRTIWQAENNAQETMTIPAGNLATGLYFLSVHASDGEVRTYKLIKE
jgi:aminopeptidase N